MENILKQTPTNSNTNFIDHLYCHPSEASKNYVRKNNHNSTTTTTNNGGGNNENAATTAITINTDDSSESMLQEEINSLKSMLLFHFDLIQTQAEQLQAKELELKTQKAECEKLRVRNTQLIGQVADIQQQLEEQMKRNIVIKRSSLPPPPLAKIQCLNDNVNVNNTKGFVTTTSSTAVTSIPTIANTTLADLTRMPKLSTLVNVKKVANSEANVKMTTAIVRNNQNKTMATTMHTPPLAAIKEDKTQTISAKLKLNKIKDDQDVQLTKTKKKYDYNNVETNKIDEEKEKPARDTQKSSHSNETTAAQEIKNKKSVKSIQPIDGEVKEEISINNMKRCSSTVSIKATTASSETTNCFSSIHSPTSCSSPCSSSTLQRCHSKRKRCRKVPVIASEEESVNSFDSTLDIETRSTAQNTPPPTESCADDTASVSYESSVDCCEREDCSGCSESGSSLTTATVTSDQTLKEPQYLYYTVNSPYMSRPWQEEELDGDLEDDIAEALRAAEPKLEIPKWTEHDIVPLYNIEGTEDLSNETFAKRHAKLELDEKRRKKWDVQQIREQRRLEKLRKRHCKDELNQSPVIQSFFPLNEDLEKICFVDTLPVQAFGEPIPMLPHNGEGFLLPWLCETDGRPLPPPKKATEFYRFGLKKMTRREEKLWEEYLDEVEDASQDMENNELQPKDERSEIKEENLADDVSIKIESEKQLEAAKETNERMEQNKMDTSSPIKEELDARTTANSKCDNENPAEEHKLRIADCCYAAPTVMLAKNCRPCASRTQQRRRLRYSSYIYINKRRRQLSMSTTNKTTIANNTNNNNSTITTLTVATGTKTTSSSISSLVKPTTATSTITTATINPAKKKNILPLNNKMSIVNTNTTTTVKNITSTRKSRGQGKVAATTTTTTFTSAKNQNNTLNNSSTTTITTTSLDKTKENNTTNKCAEAAANAIPTTASEKSDKAEQDGATTTTTKLSIMNNSIKSKLRNIRSSASPCSYRSSSNSNSSTYLDNITTITTTTAAATMTSTSLSITTTTSTLVTETK